MTEDMAIFKKKVLGKYHFSIDDVFDQLTGDYKKDNFWIILKDLHIRYEAQVSLNLMYQSKNEDLKKNLGNVLKNIYHRIGNQCEEWLYMAPHTYHFNVAPYQQSQNDFEESFDKLFNAIDHFVPENRKSKFVRLHYYSEIPESISYLKKNGLEGLFTTDRESGSYHLSNQCKKELLLQGFTQYDNFWYVRTQFRVETLVDEKMTKGSIRDLIEKHFDNYRFLVFYTHDYEMCRPEIKDALYTCFEILKTMKIISWEHL